MEIEQMLYSELQCTEAIRKAVERMGFTEMTEVQEKTIPVMMAGRDVIAKAPTGTGKTCAFGIPVVQQIDPDRKVPQAVVLAPTRELAQQIAAELTELVYFMPQVQVVCVYGGANMDKQARQLAEGCQIVVATPGRLMDHYKRRSIDLSCVEQVILDEADEMLNMGFTDSINAILENIPQDRNTLMFSATMSPEIARIAKTYLHEAKEITVGTKNEGSKNVNHVAYIVHAKDKYLALKRVVDFYPQIYGIVFCRTRKETQEIADKLIQDGYNADSLHGELSQVQRDLVMQKFRQRHLQLLVATDVAARGLDVNDLTHVINYGLPDDTESYTHRSGRTGRAGKTGISIAIINLREKGRMKEIEHIIKKKFEVSVLPSGQEICQQQLIKVIDDIEKVKVNEEEIETFLPGIYRKLDWLDKEDLIKRVVSLEFNRFLDYYKNAPEIEQPKANEKKSEAKESRKGDKEKVGRKAEKGYTRLFLNLGKTDGFYTNQIIDLVNRNLRKERIQIGRIDLMQNFSFFEVIQEQAPQVLKALNKVVLSGGRKVCVEIAGENTGKSDKSGKKKKVAAEKKADKPSKVEKAKKPSREERGYTSPRGPKKKDDWKQFFQQDNQPLRGEEPDFSEEGWAKRSKRKK